jgi:hypothetical protein
VTVRGRDISCDECGLVITTPVARGPMPGRPANEPVRAYAIGEKGWGIDGQRDLCASHVTRTLQAHDLGFTAGPGKLRPVVLGRELPDVPKRDQPLGENHRPPSDVRHGNEDERVSQ